MTVDRFQGRISAIRYGIKDRSETQKPVSPKYPVKGCQKFLFESGIDLCPVF